MREDLDHCETSSGIYAWIPSKTVGNHGKFSLLRDVATRNIIDLQFVGIYPFRYEFYYEPTETFAVFIHSISLIEVFKWDPDLDNFQFFQTIALDDEYQITGVTSLNVRDSTYMVISSVPQGLLVYEYRCVEVSHLVVILFVTKNVNGASNKLEILCIRRDSSCTWKYR